MEEILAGLNEAQKKAVTTTEGYIRVIAGAGSGKTRALAARFAYLVEAIGILSGNILCVTFTNKSANEMRQRIHQLTGDNDTGYICTFHSFCVSILQEDSYAVSYPKNFQVLDNADIDAMLKIIYEERGLTLRHMTFGNARDRIEIRKQMTETEYYRDLIAMPLDGLYRKYQEAVEAEDIIFYGYLYQQKKCFGLDYNDLINFSLYIFEQNEEICRKWQERLEYIMIDEFQDIDAPQYRLMRVLCGYHKNLFVVGDPDQTIYTWRGANIRYLLDFDRAFPGTETISMLQNYRSTPQILAAANSLIEKNSNRIPKRMEPVLADGAPVICHYADRSEEEAEWITDRIVRLQEEGVPLKDVAILYRAHYLTRSLEDIFLKRKIPYHIYSGVQFFQRMEIKDALSYLKMILYRDDTSFLRIANVPKRNLGERRMNFLQEYSNGQKISLYEALKQNRDHEIMRGARAGEFIDLIEKFSSEYSDRSVSEILADILDQSGYETMLRTGGSQERLDNLAELKQSVFEYETSCGEECTLEHYLKRVALFTNMDISESADGDAVKMMTVHAAKGLEFPNVFLCGMNEGIFPSRKINTPEGMEEERRLAFVAMTRAKERLFLSEAGGRDFDGSPRYPSRFLLDIDEQYLTYDKKPREGLIAAARDYIHAHTHTPRPAENYLQPGTKVHHFVFGDGVVVEIDSAKEAHLIQFEGMDTPRRLSVRAKLEIIKKEVKQE